MCTLFAVHRRRPLTLTRMRTAISVHSQSHPIAVLRVCRAASSNSPLAPLSLSLCRWPRSAPLRRTPPTPPSLRASALRWPSFAVLRGLQPRRSRAGMSSAASNGPNQTRRDFHEKHRKEAFKLLQNKKISSHQRLCAAISVMGYSLVEHLPEAHAVREQFTVARRAASELLRNPFFAAQLKEHESAWFHFYYAIALFQRGETKEANQQLSVSENSKHECQKCRSLFWFGCSLCAVASLWCAAQLALEAGDAIWRQEECVEMMVEHRYMDQGLRGPCIDSSNLRTVRTGECIDIGSNARDIFHAPARFRPGAPGTFVVACLSNESPEASIARYCRLAGMTPPDVVIDVPVQVQRPDGSTALRCSKEELDASSDTLKLNNDEHQRMHKEEKAPDTVVAPSVLLVALGFSGAESGTELQIGVSGRMSQLADVFTDVPGSLPIHSKHRLSDVMPLAFQQPTRTIWVSAHGRDDGAYGQESLSDVVKFLHDLHDNTTTVSTVVLFGCDVGSALLDSVRSLCRDIGEPLRFHLVVFHAKVGASDSRAANLMRSLLSDDQRFEGQQGSSLGRTQLRRHRLQENESFDRFGASALAKQGFTQLDQLSFLQRALVLCTTPTDLSLHQRVGASVVPSLPNFVPCSVYFPFLGDRGRVIGAGAEWDSLAADFLQSQ